MKRSSKLIVIGGSAGGISVVQSILEIIDGKVTVPVVVVLHLPESLSITPSMVFPTKTLKVKEARDKDAIEDGTVYMAPGGYHLLIEKDATFSLSQDEPVFYCRPSIDVTFESVIKVFGTRAMGVLLTGANEDGAAGLAAMKKFGCITLVQDPKQSEAPVMPQSAIELFTPEFIGSAEDLGRKIVELFGGRDRE